MIPVKIEIKIDPEMPSDEIYIEQDGKRLVTMINMAKEDPKPELSISTLMINLEILNTRMEIARLAYSKAYLEWLHLGEQIKNRLAEEQRTAGMKALKL